MGKLIKSPHEIISSNIEVSKTFIILSILSAVIYFTWWLNLSKIGHPVLFGALFIGEIYHVWQAIGFSLTVWDQKRILSPKIKQYLTVDVFITVCGEPPKLVEETIAAATSLDYPKYKVYVLNDGFSRNLPGWEEVNEIALKYGATPIVRETNKGNKAGNVNNALSKTSGELVVIFDADHVPHRDFLKKTVGFFKAKKVALVQTPQYYVNREQNFLTTAAWEQQELFFGPICRGKNFMNATFWCGTNAILRRKALEDIKGVPENNIAEDFLASLFFHERAWETVYLAEVLAEGLAPQNLANYVTQQFRWARGSSELMFRYNPILNKRLTWAQKIQYLYSSSYYLNGFIALIDAVVPLLVLFTGVNPVKDMTADFMIYFFPFIFFTINLLMLSTGNTITFRAVQLSMSSSYVFIRAVLGSLFGIKSGFKVTSKEYEGGNFIKLAVPHIVYTFVGVTAMIVGVVREGFVPSVITNASWVLFNIIMFFGFIRVAYPWQVKTRALLDRISLAMKPREVTAGEFAEVFVDTEEENVI